MPTARQEVTGSPRIPSLDGLRALAVGIVVLSHLPGAEGFPLSLAVLPTELGRTGVRLFFVISGYLITGILRSEILRSGTIRLGRFYFRRTVRIFPPYYAFLFVIAVGGAAGLLPFSWKDLLRCAAYVSDFGPLAGYPLGHTWSLAVEEQFYLLWPPILLLLGLARARWVPIAMLIVVPFIAMAESGAGVVSAGRSFETVSNYLAAGCALALWKTELERLPAIHRLMRSAWLPALAVPAILCEPYVHGVPHSWLITGTMQVVALPLLLLWLVKNPFGRAGRLLNARPVAYVGRLSYSLYLWQQPFITGHSLGGWARGFPAGLILAAATAVGSFYLVEQPALRWRARFEQRRGMKTALSEEPEAEPREQWRA